MLLVMFSEFLSLEKVAIQERKMAYRGYQTAIRITHANAIRTLKGEEQFQVVAKHWVNLLNKVMDDDYYVEEWGVAYSAKMFLTSLREGKKHGFTIPKIFESATKPLNQMLALSHILLAIDYLNKEGEIKLGDAYNLMQHYAEEAGFANLGRSRKTFLEYLKRYRETQIWIIFRNHGEKRLNFIKNWIILLLKILNLARNYIHL